MEAARRYLPDGPVRVTNRQGASPFVLVCEHASNFIPAQFGTLGLECSELSRHIAWDPGALPVPRAPHPALAPLLQIQAFYRMANALACERGYNPDRPRHVQKVTQTV